jgi:hypothetical protein
MTQVGGIDNFYVEVDRNGTYTYISTTIDGCSLNTEQAFKLIEKIVENSVLTARYLDGELHIEEPESEAVLKRRDVLSFKFFSKGYGKLKANSGESDAIDHIIYLEKEAGTLT